MGESINMQGGSYCRQVAQDIDTNAVCHKSCFTWLLFVISFRQVLKLILNYNNEHIYLKRCKNLPELIVLPVFVCLFYLFISTTEMMKVM